MEVLSKDEIKFLIELSFSAISHGKVSYGRQICEHLLSLDSSLHGAKIALAFSYIVIDEFKDGDEILDNLIKEDPNNYEAIAFLSLSKSLQKDDLVLSLVKKVPESETCYSLCKNALEIYNNYEN